MYEKTQAGVNSSGITQIKTVPMWGQSPTYINTTNVITFSRTATLTSAAAATGVTLIADSEVPVGYVPYMTNFRAKVDGATVWGTTATVKVQDTNGTPVDFITMAVAALTANAFVKDNTTNVTAEAAYAKNTGGTAGKGIRVIGNANGTGSDLVVTADFVYIKLT